MNLNTKIRPLFMILFFLMYYHLGNAQETTRQLSIVKEGYYTWTNEIPDSAEDIDLGGIYILRRLPASRMYCDNLSSMIHQFAPDSTFRQWPVTPIPVMYGSHTSSGVSFDSLARATGNSINLNTGRNLLVEGGVTDYGIVFQYVAGDSSWLEKELYPDGTPKLATINIAQSAYNPGPLINRLFAAALGFHWSLDNTSISGGAPDFSARDFQSLNTFFGHPVLYDLRPSVSDTSRGDAEDPHMVLSAPSTATTNEQVIFVMRLRALTTPALLSMRGTLIFQACLTLTPSPQPQPLPLRIRMQNHPTRPSWWLAQTPTTTMPARLRQSS